MSTTTTNFSFILPSVNDPTDQDLWGGESNSNWSKLDTLLKQVQIPVGGLYFSTTDSDPGDNLGYGTWIAFAAGQVLVGVGTNTDGTGSTQTFTAGQTGGNYVDVASHRHNFGYTTFGAAAGPNNYNSARPTGGTEAVTELDGDTGAITNIPPFVSVYIWLRQT